MKIRFISDTNIRNTPDDLSDRSLVGQVYAGVELVVENTAVRGVHIEGNNTWWKGPSGWYYWSGGTELLEEADIAQTDVIEIPSIQPTQPVSPQTVADVQTQSILMPADLLDDLDNNANASGIPEGETRPLPQAVRAEARGILAPPQMVLDIDSIAPKVVSQPKPRLNPSPPISNATPDASSLNWGIEQRNIESHWWQGKNNTGQKIRIAILSTGCLQDSNDLRHAIEDWYTVPGLNKGPVDQDGLGTEAAVIAAGRGLHVSGVAPGARLLIAKIGEFDHQITPDSLLDGLDWAISKGANVIAMLVDFSNVEPVQQQHLEDLVAIALQRNILLVAPVGNSGERSPQVRFPASIPGVLAVGAHDIEGKRAAFSAKSKYLDLLAPGQGLLSLDLDDQPTHINQPTTAIATAFVAGVLALLRQDHPEQPPEAIYDLLRNAALSPRPYIKRGEDTEFGYGLLNVGGL